MPRQLSEHKKEAYFQILIQFLGARIHEEAIIELLNGYSKEIHFDWRTANRETLVSEAAEAFISMETRILILNRLLHDANIMELPQIFKFCDRQAVVWNIPTESWNAIHPGIVKASVVSELGPD
jgi:hypothetical protein